MLTNFEVPQKPDTFGVVPERRLLFGGEVEVVKIEKEEHDYTLHITAPSKTVKRGNREVEVNPTTHLRADMYDIVEEMTQPNPQDPDNPKTCYISDSDEYPRNQIEFVPHPDLRDYKPYKNSKVFVVTGMKRFGKTSFLKFLVREIDRVACEVMGKTISFVFIDPHTEFTDIGRHLHSENTIVVSPDADLKSDVYFEVYSEGRSYKQEFRDHFVSSDFMRGMEITFQRFTYALIKDAFLKRNSVVFSLPPRFFQDQSGDINEYVYKKFVSDVAQSLLSVSAELKAQTKRTLWSYFIGDEMHYFMRGRYNDISVGAINSLALEGGKFGISVGVASHYPTDFHLNFLKQADANYIGKISPHSDDVQQISEMLPPVPTDPDKRGKYVKNTYSKLKKGEFGICYRRGDEKIDGGFFVADYNPKL